MLFLSILRARDLRGLVANAEHLFLPRRRLSLLNAAMVTLSVWYAIVKHVGFGKASPVDLGANRQVTNEMAEPICKVCLKDRRLHGRNARRIFRTPVEITQDQAFNRKGIPARLCSVCDGDAYERAMQAHRDRTGRNDG